MTLGEIARALEAEAQDPFKDVVQWHVDEARKHYADIVKGGGTGIVTKANDDAGESGTGDFMDFEELLAGVMAVSWSRKAKGAADTMITTITAGSNEGATFKVDQLDRAVAAVDTTMSNLVTADDEARMKLLLKQSARRGAAVIDAVTALEQTPRFSSILDNMVKASRYYTNNYFNSQVIPSLYKAVQGVLDDNNLTEADRIYKAVREAIDKRLLKRTPYWQTVSSGAASRAYHYGLIKAGRARGYVGYELVAVMDSRTSDICRRLDRKQFWLADAEKLYDRVANAQDEDIKDIHPWLTARDVEGFSAQEVYDRAPMVPPFHGRCRTTMRLLKA